MDTTEEKEQLTFATCIHCGRQLQYGPQSVTPGYWTRLTTQAQEAGWKQTPQGWLCPTAPAQ